MGVGDGVAAPNPPKYPLPRPNGFVKSKIESRGRVGVGVSETKTTGCVWDDEP